MYGTRLSEERTIALIVRLANRGESSQEVLNNRLDRSLNHYIAIMPWHSIIARSIRAVRKRIR